MFVKKLFGVVCLAISAQCELWYMDPESVAG